MATRARWTPPVAASFVFILSVFISVSSLPIQNENGEYTGAQPLGAAVDSGAGAPAKLSENMIPSGNGNQMFPSNMPPPPPGAMADGGFPNIPKPSPANLPLPLGGAAYDNEEQPGNGGQMFPPNMPPPPPGAMADGGFPNIPKPSPANLPLPLAGAAYDNEQQPGNGGQMFPPNMPPPPPGALADGAFPNPPKLSPENLAEQKEAVAVQGDNVGPMFPPNIPPPPPGAMNDGSPAMGAGFPPVQLATKDVLNNVPLNGGLMFPPNMPPAPPGAQNDGAQGAIPATGNQVALNSIPLQPGQMFPPNMPPPPPGAVNDPVMPPQMISLTSSQSADQAPVNSAEKNNTQGQSLVPKVTSGSTFPSNMSAPPAGAANQPQAQIVPAVPPSNAAFEPVYVTGQQVPPMAQSTGGQNPFVNPANMFPRQNQAALNEVGPEQQDTALANMYPENGPVALPNPSNGVFPQSSSSVNVSNNPTDANIRPISGNAESTEAEVTPRAYQSPEIVGEEEVLLPQNSENQQSGQSGTPKTTFDTQSEPLSAGEDSSEERYEESDAEYADSEYSFEEDEESESDYSWMDFIMDSESTSYEDNSVSSEESEEYWSEESSDYSTLDWIMDSSKESEWEGEMSDESEEEGSEAESEWDSKELEEAVEEEEAFEEALEHELDVKFKHKFVPNVHRQEPESSGGKLILYCIPGIILAVLIMLAWKNYRGKIRVVAVPNSSDSRNYDWKPASKVDEQMEPMLKSRDEENTY